MIVTLKIAFNSITNIEFKITNPVVLPREGEILDFKWRDFIDDTLAVADLDKFGENGCWICNIVSRHYSKREQVIQIVLFEKMDCDNHLNKTN